MTDDLYRVSDIAVDASSAHWLARHKLKLWTSSVSSAPQSAHLELVQATDGRLDVGGGIVADPKAASGNNYYGSGWFLGLME